MAENPVQPINSSISTRKLIQFVRLTDLRKRPQHARAIHDELEARKARSGRAAA